MTSTIVDTCALPASSTADYLLDYAAY